MAVAFVTMAIAFAQNRAFSVFFVALKDEFHWSRASTAGAFSIFLLVYGICAPISGILVDRFGARLVLPVGVAIMGASLAAASQIDSLWQLYLFYGVIGAIGISCAGSVPIVTVIQHWFVRQRALASGLACAGIGVGAAVLVPLTQYMTTAYGWRSAMLMLAILMIAIPVPLNALLMRQRPADKGLAADGVRAGSGGADRAVHAQALVVDHKWAGREWTLGRALATYRFWCLFLGGALGEFGLDIVLVHQLAAFADAGYEPMAAASSFSVATLVGASATLGWGWVSDRLGREVTYALGIACMLAAVLALIAAGTQSSLAILYLYAVLFGLGNGVMAPTYFAAPADVFQGRNFGAIFGVLILGVGLAGATGPLAAGYIFDASGSYVVAFVAVFAAFSLSILCFWLAAPRKVRLVPGRIRVKGQRY